jgi:hypothetical protein
MRTISIFTQYLSAVNHIRATWYDNAIIVHDRICGTGITCYYNQELANTVRIPIYCSYNSSLGSENDSQHV